MLAQAGLLMLSRRSLLCEWAEWSIMKYELLQTWKLVIYDRCDRYGTKSKMMVVYSAKIESGLYRDNKLFYPAFNKNSGWPANFREKVWKSIKWWWEWTQSGLEEATVAWSSVALPSTSSQPTVRSHCRRHHVFCGIKCHLRIRVII